MTAYRNQLAYQEAAVRSASAVELIIILYDILSRDLHAAIEAIEGGNIELRSAKLKQLEGSLNRDEGGEMATNMSRFYSMLRGQMMKAQIQQDADILRELVQLLFSVREAWVELSGRLGAPALAPTAQAPSRVSNTSDVPSAGAASWKA
jgi:flagellar protein FliS